MPLLRHLELGDRRHTAQTSLAFDLFCKVVCINLLRKGVDNDVNQIFDPT